jgi:hypothetical protein
MNWGTFRTQIRRSILEDATSITWPNDDLLADLCGWALDTFCAHTASPTSVTYTGVSGSTLTLPSDVYGDFESTGYVYLRSSTTVTLVKPARLLDAEDTENLTFSVWGSTLQFSESVTEDVVLRYFALYPHPSSDSDELAIPAWAYNALAHLIGALALTTKSVSSANIDRFKGPEDKGGPEDNALRAQQIHLLRVYEQELARHPRQIRENSYQRLLL